ncbi:MAG: tetratricopeptide repeat protein [Vicinamibacterales bacterium]
MIIVVLLAFLSAAPQIVPQDPARVGAEALQRGDGEKAAAAFRAVLAQNPRDTRAMVGAAMAAHLQGQDDESVRMLKKALEIAPDDLSALYLLGPLAYGQGDVDLAITSYDKLVKLAPGNQHIFQQLQEWQKEAALNSTFQANPTARFTVLFDGPQQQEIAERVSAMLEAAYVRVGAALGAYPPETITAILYTREQFHDITKSPSWAAAAYDGRIKIPVMGALKTPAELDRIVTHEFTHAVVHQLYPGIPDWLNEGLATFMEPADHRWLTARLKGADWMIPMSKLNQAFRTPDANEASVAYAESYVGTKVLAERLGANFPTFLQYVSNGTAIDQALMLFGISPSDVEREWTRRASAPR